jgi:WD40 repeat protein/serine/threonine protein kinase
MGAFKVSFDAIFQTRLPLPLARLYARAFHAKGERERHDHAFHLLEAGLKLAAAAFVARYRCRDRRSLAADAALRQLAMPSLGQWLAIARETLKSIGEREAEDPWGERVLARLSREDEKLHDVFVTLARAAGHAGRIRSRPSLLETLDLLPAYRNAMSDAHGSVKLEPQAYARSTPALLGLATALFDEGALLGGGRLVYAEDVKVAADGARRAVWLDLAGTNTIRRQSLQGEPVAGEVLPERLYLELDDTSHLPVHPLVYYQAGEIVDQVFFLNRARGGRGTVQFLSYATGDFYLPGRDPTGDLLIRDLDELLSWVTATRVDAKMREALADASRAADGGDAPGAQAAPAEPTGAVFGDYEILGELGRGGMAVVYQARQRSLNRLVALKVLPPTLRSDDVALARFRREVKALSRCDHQNVIKILSFGEAEGTYYYAMEYIDGGDLATIGEILNRYRSTSGDGILKEGHFDRAASSATTPPVSNKLSGLPSMARIEPSPPVELREGRHISFRLACIIRDAAYGAHHLHELGIVHRDLKPQNIMVTREDHRPVVMDLGLAKMTEVSQSLSLDRGGVLGTLRYMPPEQLQRRLLEVDARADIYSLGAVLYELCCHRPMLDGDTEERLTAQILFEEPLPPQRANPRLPNDLATIISKATRKDPRDRYRTAAEFADDLDRFSRGEAIAARPPTPGYLLRLFVKRHLAAVVFAGLAAFFLIALLFGWAVFLRSALHDRETALTERSTALLKAEESLGASNRSLALLFEERARRAMADRAYQRAAIFAARSLEIHESPTVRGTLYLARSLAPRTPSWTSPARPGEVEAVAFAPDGKSFASGHESGVIYLWNAADGRERRRFEGRRGPVTSLVFFPDGSRLASASVDGTLIVWNAASGEELRRLEGHAAAVEALALDPAGDLLGSASRDGTVRLWNLRSAAQPAVLQGHSEGVEAIAFSPDGARLATGSRDETVRLWDARSHEQLAQLDPGGGRVFDLAFSPDGTLLAAAMEDGTLRLLSADLSAKPQVLEGHAARLHAVAFSPDGRRLASGSLDGTIRLWDLDGAPGKTPAPAILAEHDDDVRALAFDPGGARLLSGSRDRTLRLWDVEKRLELSRLHGHSASVLGVAVSPGGDLIASASADWTVLLWRATDGEELGELRGHRAAVTAVALSPAGGLLATASFDLTVRLWQLPGGQPARVLRGHLSVVHDVTFHPSAKLLGSASEDGTVRLWDAETGDARRVLDAGGRPVTALAFSTDGALAALACGPALLVHDVANGALVREAPFPGAKATAVTFAEGDLVAVGFEDGAVRLVAARSGEELAKTPADEVAVHELRWEGPGGRLACARGDGMVSLRSLPELELLQVLEGHTGAVHSVAFGAAGETIVSGSEDGTVRLWEAPPWSPRGMLLGHKDEVQSVAFHPDGKLLASGSKDGEVHLWDVERRSEAGPPLPAAGTVNSVAFDASGRILAVSEQGGIVIWDWRRHEVRRRLATSGPVFALAFTPDGSRIVLAGQDGLLEVRQVTTSEAREELGSAHMGTVHAMTLSADGALLATGSQDRSVRLWKAPFREPQFLRGHNSPIWSVAFDSRAAILATGARDGALILWDTASCARVGALVSHEGAVCSLAFAPGGEWLASGSADRTLRLWDLANRKALALLSGHGGPVLSLAVSPDGRWLVSSSADHSVRCWDVSLLLEAGNLVCRSIERETGLIVEGAEARPGPVNRLVHR